MNTDFRMASVEKGHDAQTTDISVEDYYPSAMMNETKWTRLGLTPRSFGKAEVLLDEKKLHKTIKRRHLHMIAIGGCVGAGLFVGSGGALQQGGPASLLIAL